MAKRLGFGDYQYELVENWPKIVIQGAVSDVTVDSQGRAYAGVRNPQADGSVGVSSRGTGHVVVLDRDGNEVGNWGNFATAPHGMWVNQNDEFFHADAGNHTITKHAPTGEVLLTLGTRNQVGTPPGAPFNRCTHAVQAPTATSSSRTATARTGSTASRTRAITSSRSARARWRLGPTRWDRPAPDRAS